MSISLEYYAYASFIAGLICGIAVVCKVLFANIKGQKKLLDEQESKVLQLYTSVETLMEEFDDQVKMISAELKEHEYRATSQMSVFDLPPELEKKERELEKLPRNMPFDANRIRAAGEVLDRAERMAGSDIINFPGQNSGSPASTANTAQSTVKPASGNEEENAAIFQKFFDDAADASPSIFVPRSIPAQPQQSAQSRSEAILTLADEGKNDAEIASELGITRNEVQLVIGLKR